MKRVLLVYSEFLLGLGLESILVQEEDLVVQAVEFTCITNLYTQIAQFKPQVIILDQSLQNAGVFQLLDVLENDTEARIISISLENNKLEIYQKYELVVRHSQDLLRSIRTSIPLMGLGQ